MTRPEGADAVDGFDRLLRGDAAVEVGEGAPHVPEPTGSRVDEWWSRLTSTPARARAWAWGIPAVITVLAAVLRLWNLGQPGTLVFDETYYVKDAWTLLNLGYEGRWPAEANDFFNAGVVDGYSTTGTYVVHPPLGKWVIAIGLALVGADNAAGWRVSTAIVGVLLVVLVMLVARHLFRSTLVTALAGLFFAIDGHAIVMSRTALLDGILAFFVLLGVGAVLLDRRHHAARVAAWVAKRRDASLSTTWGPSLWGRPWLLAAGVAFGAACAVKWNGAYFFAAFALYSVVSDALERRRAGVTFWASGTLFRQAPVSFVLTVPVAALVYVASWSGWLATDGGYYRQWAQDADHRFTGILEWVPLSLQSLWQYHVSAYTYHVGQGTPHGWQSNPLTWLLQVRPTMMFYEGTDSGVGGCLAERCGAVVHDVANPLLWWAGVAALVYLIYRFVVARQWQVGVVLLGVAAGYVPWLFYLNRTVFQFYTIVFWPFLIIGLAYALSRIAGRRSDPSSRREGGLLTVTVFVVAAVAVGAFFYPLHIGETVPVGFIQWHYWLPSWR